MGVKKLWEQHLTFLKFFYWSIVDLQCCVNFCCTAKWLSYTYIYILFNILFHYGLSQNIEYSSLCYPVGPCCLFLTFLNKSFLFLWKKNPLTHTHTCMHAYTSTYTHTHACVHKHTHARIHRHIPTFCLHLGFFFFCVQLSFLPVK